ncbi:MAG: hypothetical protein JWQ35_1959 [Bacteriovoracaceae bacterium]|nr:hypothetical protein [Bacteriovoracaceae bacterium]
MFALFSFECLGISQILANESDAPSGNQLIVIAWAASHLECMKAMDANKFHHDIKDDTLNIPSAYSQQKDSEMIKAINALMREKKMQAGTRLNIKYEDGTSLTFSVSKPKNLYRSTGKGATDLMHLNDDRNQYSVDLFQPKK